MIPVLSQELAKFCAEKEVFSKGKLAAVLYMTSRAIEDGLPYDLERLRTERQGQVAGLSREAVQKILLKYQITRVLAEEGGRTSRGSLGLAADYISLLNQLHKRKVIKVMDLREIESWWIGKVRDLFNRQCFKISLDPALTMSAFVAGLLTAARKRQAEVEGLRVEGAVLHYLVGAKLKLLYPAKEIAVRGFSVADDVSADKGDFFVGSTIVHATTAPSEKLLTKCQSNIEAGLRPLIICPGNRVAMAVGMAEAAKLASRVEVFDAEMFVSANINEHGHFEAIGIQQSVRDLISIYNSIIDAVESDHSFKIEAQ